MLTGFPPSPVPLRRFRVWPAARRRLSDPRSCAQTGAVTAETAVVLPALVAVLAAAVWVVSLAGATLRCVDAAREAARALARGETVASARLLAQQVAPPGADVRTSSDGGLLRVTVQAPAHPPGPVLGRLPTVTVTGDAVTVAEGGELDAGTWARWSVP